MTTKRISFEQLKDLKLETTQLTVVDHETGEEKIVKTVAGANVACTTAYMLGVPDEQLDAYFSHRHSELLEKLHDSKEASIIRYLAKIRTELFKNFKKVDKEIVYMLSNIDRMCFFDKEEINQLQRWGVPVVQTSCRAENYVKHVNKLIETHIGDCKELYPESVSFEYIKRLFVIPKPDKKDTFKKEFEMFQLNRNLYPFQVYMHWSPEECGNMLSSDTKFLSIIYRQNGDAFTEAHRYRDADEATKESIYDYIHQSEQVVMVVDCENSDPFKLYAMIKSLKQEEISQIRTIVLYDDYHTTMAWDFIERLISIPVKHVEVPRVTDHKSLVDIQMAVGVAKAYYRDGVDSFILCSSDSDFGGLIYSLPDARFLVACEKSKCGNAMKEMLSREGIFYCEMDEFYLEHATILQHMVVKEALKNHFPDIFGCDAWEMTKRIYRECYIEASEKEMRRFFDKYVKTLKMTLDEKGCFAVSYTA